MQVIDNFLPEYPFRLISNVMLSREFSWKFHDGVVGPNDGQCQFSHAFFDIRYGGILSKYYSLFDFVQQKLGVGRLDRIKSNLNPKTVFHRKGGYHTDQRHPREGYPLHQKTAVLYLNTNNGWTQFKKGGKVKSVANRIVIFDSNLEHTGVTCTNEKRRVIVNFNYDVLRGN